MSSLDCSLCWPAALSFSTGCVYFTFFTLWFAYAGTLTTCHDQFLGSTEEYESPGPALELVGRKWWLHLMPALGQSHTGPEPPYGPLKSRDAFSTSFYRVSTQRSLVDDQSHPPPQEKVLHGAPESHRRRPATQHNSNQVYLVKVSPTAHTSTQPTQSVFSIGGRVCWQLLGFASLPCFLPPHNKL